MAERICIVMRNKNGTIINITNSILVYIRRGMPYVRHAPTVSMFIQVLPRTHLPSANLAQQLLQSFPFLRNAIEL